jgi:hypothetical protein
MKFRIITNGKEYIVQKKGWIFWRVAVAAGYQFLKMNPFPTYKDAEAEIRKAYGENAYIANKDRYVVAVMREH